MEVVIVRCPAEVGGLAADIFAAAVSRQPAAVLGLATGSSPRPVYRELIRRYRQGRVRFDRARVFLLDEYVGLPGDHPSSYRRYIEREFTVAVGVDAARIESPDGAADDLLAECARYEAAIRDVGGVEVQLLGVGRDGHIGFNEPGSSLGSRTRPKTLTEQTRADNARFFASPGEVPTHVLTQGVGTILDARHIVLVATGPGKAEPIAGVVEGPVTAMVPGSALQLHPHVTVIVDDEAAAGLELADYYRETFAAKPAWQPL